MLLNAVKCCEERVKHNIVYLIFSSTMLSTILSVFLHASEEVCPEKRAKYDFIWPSQARCSVAANVSPLAVKIMRKLSQSNRWPRSIVYQHMYVLPTRIHSLSVVNTMTCNR